MKKSVLILTLICLTSASAQPEVCGEYFFEAGSISWENFDDIYVVSDGGFVMCGESDNELWVVRTNSIFETTWNNKYETGNRLYSIIETDDGGFLCGGYSGSDNSKRFAAVLLDGNGNIEWQNDYAEGRCWAVLELKSGEFLLIGETGQWIGLIILIRQNGEVIWRRTYQMWNECQNSFLTGGRETEGGVVVVGTGRAPDRQFLFWAIKINFEGNPIWSDTMRFEPQTGGNCWSIASSPEGGFVLGGSGSRSNQEGNGNHNVLLVSNISSEGRWQWNRILDGGERVADNGGILVRMGDRGYAIAGRRSIDGSMRRGLIYRLSSRGNVVWTRIFEFDEDERLNDEYNGFAAITRNNDGKIFAAGTVNNRTNNRGQDGMVIELDPELSGGLVVVYTPIDTVFSVLPGDSILFAIHASNSGNLPMQFDWTYDDSLFSHDTSEVILFDSLDQILISGRVVMEDWENRINWHVTVSNLFISAFTSDTLALTLHRGSSVDFSLDTIRFTDGDEPEILWTKTNLSNGQVENSGEDAQATVDFPWSGDYEVEGQVSRGESSDAVTWSVTVRGAIWAFVPEADSLEVLADSVVHFEVVPSAPEDESLTIQWFVDGEVVREGEVGLDWAFSTVDNCRRYLVQCVVADSVEADTVAWVVEVRELGVGDNKEVGQAGTPVLLSVSPNPFNSMLTIRYATGGLETAATRIAVYDVAGREVFSAVTAPSVTGGNSNAVTRGGMTAERVVVWDASSVPAGVYFVRLQAGQEVATKKVVLMR